MSRKLNKDEIAHIAKFCNSKMRGNLRLLSAEIANEIPVTCVYIRNVVFYNAIINTDHNRGMQISFIDCKFYGLQHFINILNMHVLKIAMLVLYGISLIKIIVAAITSMNSVINIVINIISLYLYIANVYKFISAYVARDLGRLLYLLMFIACSVQYPVLIFAAIFCNTLLIGGYSLYNLIRYGPWSLYIMFSSRTVYILQN